MRANTGTTPRMPGLRVASLLLLVTQACLGEDFCTPKDSCWPDASAFEDLRKVLDGQIVQPSDPLFVSATKGVIQNTRFLANPGVIVFVNSTRDVQLCVLFAKENKIDISIVSSGHDFIGRNTKKDSLQINLSRLNNITIDKDDDASDTKGSIRVGVGNRWGRVYEEVDKAGGYVVVGGSSETVSMGGYTLGGGHSPMSRQLGLAVDSVMEITMVLASGEKAVVDARGVSIEDPNGNVRQSSDTSLFWALRGGGGSTFGIATEIKFKLHKAPEEFSELSCIWPFVSPLNPRKIYARDVLNMYNKVYPTLSRKWGGYLLVFNPYKDVPGRRDSAGAIVLALRYFGKSTDAANEAKDITSFHTDWMAEINAKCTMKKFSTFFGQAKLVKDRGNFGPGYIWSSMLQRESFNEKLTDTIVNNMLRYSGYKLPVGCTGTHIGGRVGDFSLNSSSISPGFRTGMMAMTCGSGWAKPEDGPKIIQGLQPFQNALIALGKGVYYNEPPAVLKNWKTMYWGPNYARLLDVKKRYDPHNTFSCWHCVGSDLPRVVTDKLPNIGVIG